MATRKEMFAAMANHFEDMGEGYEEYVEFCTKNVAALTKAAERPRKPSKSAEASRKFAEDVLDWMTETGADSYVNADVANGFEVSPQKAAAALKRLTLAGSLVKTPGEHAKDPAVYTIA